VAAGGGRHGQPLGGARLPAALLPLPALLCALAIGVMAFVELVRNEPMDLGHGAEVE
jgi:gluconokinase